MPDWVRDGSIHPFFITFQKNGVGVDLQIDGGVPANSINDGDLQVYSWKPLPEPQGTITRREVDVSAELVKVNASLAPGEVLWFPNVADTRCNCFSLVIRDFDGGGAFDENRVRGDTHGQFDAIDLDNNSRFNGT